jgi:4'-phosphopantetheinyl transferase
MVALVIAPRTDTAVGSVGIDIELLGRSRAREALIARYYHPDEHVLANTEHGFLCIWTRKEAVVKAQGMGLRIDLKSLNTAHNTIEHLELGRWHSTTLA